MDSTASKKQNSNTPNTKKKSPQACAPCRKRKVKCNGELPCDRCSRQAAKCVYDRPQQKKDTPRPSADNHRPRLQAIEKYFRQLSSLLDNTTIDETEAPMYSSPNRITVQPATHKLQIHTSGQGLYVPDHHHHHPLRTDLAATIPFDMTSPGHPPQLPLTSSPLLLMQDTTKDHLITIYFRFIDPVIPILHKALFFQQLRDRTVSQLLLNAMYCVSSRWDLGVPSASKEPRGWAYYQKAVKLLNQDTAADVSTVQAVFLLLKYNEHVRRFGFAWRTRFYFQMIVRLSKDIGLSRDSGFPLLEQESRRRTFWAVYSYDVMMSAENGMLPQFSSVPCSVDLPHVLQEEVQEGSKIYQFNSLATLMRHQSDIIQFLHTKYLKTVVVPWNEAEAFDRLSNALQTTITHIAVNTKFPQKENMCYAVCFLYLVSCFTSILLYRPYEHHKGRCLEAARHIKRIVDLVLACDAFEDMYCSIRGIQQIIHFLSAAITVFKEQGDELLESTMQLAHKLASISPSTEVVGDSSSHQLKRNIHYQQVPTNIPHDDPSLLSLLMFNESE